MPRPPRIDHNGAWHHVMNRGIDHSTVYFADTDRIEFGTRLADAHQRFGLEVHAYCLMDTHFHLLVHCPDGGLSDAMQRIGSLYTRHVNDRLGRDGALFRGRFHSRVVDSEEYLIAACRYIHRNPLDIAGISSPEQYRWSSHRTYLQLRSKPTFLRTDVVMRYFNDDPHAFARFVDDAALLTPGPHPPTETEVAKVREVAELICAERGLDSLGHLAAVARAITLLWATGHLDDDGLDAAFGFETAGARRTSVSRARALVRRRPELIEVMERATALALPAVTTGV